MGCAAAVMERWANTARPRNTSSEETLSFLGGFLCALTLRVEHIDATASECSFAKNCESVHL